MYGWVKIEYANSRETLDSQKPETVQEFRTRANKTMALFSE
jgi:hypothetical protein